MAVALVEARESGANVAPPPSIGLGRLRKVACIGSHGTTLPLTPWHDSTWEIWAHASARGLYQRPPDRYFDLHRKECWTKSNKKGQKYLRWLASNPVPIYMQDVFPEVPSSVKYPLDRITSEFRPYFTNHVAYMIALAITEGVTHLGFFGVNYGFDPEIIKPVQNTDMEYGTQRGSCEYWMGVAEGRGIHLVIPKGSTLLNDPKELYGYASHDEEGLLVPSYRRRTWIRPELAKTAPVDRLPDGRAMPPKEIRELIEKEDHDHPRSEETLRIEELVTA